MNKYISFAAAAVLSAAVLAACGTKKEPPHPVTITPVQTADTAQTIDTPETIDTPDTVKKKFSLETTELTLEEGQSEKIKYREVFICVKLLIVVLIIIIIIIIIIIFFIFFFLWHFC